MDIPMYPIGSGFSGGDLNCQPTNCDHLNVLPAFLIPLELRGVYKLSGASSGLCTHFLPIAHFPPGDCAPVLGHDHIVGVKPAGDFNVAWHVQLWLFTEIPTQRFMTLSDLKNSGIAVGPVVTPITFNCSIVSESVYDRGTPLSF